MMENNIYIINKRHSKRYNELLMIHQDRFCFSIPPKISHSQSDDGQNFCISTRLFDNEICLDTVLNKQNKMQLFMILSDFFQTLIHMHSLGVSHGRVHLMSLFLSPHVTGVICRHMDNEDTEDGFNDDFVQLVDMLRCIEKRCVIRMDSVIRCVEESRLDIAHSLVKTMMCEYINSVVCRTIRDDKSNVRDHLLLQTSTHVFPIDTRSNIRAIAGVVQAVTQLLITPTFVLPMFNFAESKIGVGLGPTRGVTDAFFDAAISFGLIVLEKDGYYWPASYRRENVLLNLNESARAIFFKSLGYMLLYAMALDIPIAPRFSAVLFHLITSKAHELPVIRKLAPHIDASFYISRASELACMRAGAEPLMCVLLDFGLDRQRIVEHVCYTSHKEQLLRNIMDVFEFVDMTHDEVYVFRQWANRQSESESASFIQLVTGSRWINEKVDKITITASSGMCSIETITCNMFMDINKSLLTSLDVFSELMHGELSTHSSFFNVN